MRANLELYRKFNVLPDLFRKLLKDGSKVARFQFSEIKDFRLSMA